MKLLIDMNLSPKWVGVLAEAGLEAMHWTALGPANAPDPEIMAYAKSYDFIVVTNDLDFGTILSATQGDKPSVVQIRSVDLNPDAIGHFVITALKQMEAELLEGALLTIDTNRTRMRLLPLGRK
ncbi:hypothetical protein FNU76_12360 [Chitinimonas arctica]|uniref:DUF5615 domain-containing protein n=1 Tax=Chitinimonas arctica TaxID=2594795 RepID=A0A516SG71_9NEIS|nr:DUF5615 family PIN-like protein [Chitinimonas arctica]QDQ27090.1 hypothetical protein FNU76_12360 [Chitinimonas arctica]